MLAVAGIRSFRVFIVVYIASVRRDEERMNNLIHCVFASRDNGVLVWGSSYFGVRQRQADVIVVEGLLLGNEADDIRKF